MEFDWSHIESLKAEALMDGVIAEIKDYFSYFYRETERINKWYKERNQEYEKEIEKSLSDAEANEQKLTREYKLRQEITREKLNKALDNISEKRSEAVKSRNEKINDIISKQNLYKSQIESLIENLDTLAIKIKSIEKSIKNGSNRKLYIQLEEEISPNVKVLEHDVTEKDLMILQDIAKDFSGATGIFKCSKARKIGRDFFIYFHAINQRIVLKKQEYLDICEQEIEKLENFKPEIENSCIELLKICRDDETKVREEYNKENAILLEKYKEQLRIQNEESKEEENRIRLNVKEKQKRLYEEYSDSKKKILSGFYDSFTKKFPPNKINSYMNFHQNSVQINVNDYICPKDIPRMVDIGTLHENVDKYIPHESIKGFLSENYKSIYQNGEFIFPYTIGFNARTNMVFEYSTMNDVEAMNNIQSIVSNLLLSIPPTKINFALLDPLKSSNTFAPFNKFVELDKSSGKILNGGTATSSSTIAEKLKIVNNHMENIISNCLKSSSMTIQKYNELAGQNAEPYEIVVVMDFPNSFSVEMAETLEKIIETGPRCGVYTILMVSKEHLEQADAQIKSVYKNMRNKMQIFQMKKNKHCSFEKTSETSSGLELRLFSMLSDQCIDRIVPIYKKGIEAAGRIIIDFESIKIPEEKWFMGNTKEEYSVPIGLIGVNNVQHVSLGGKGISHHVLIAGHSGSGKTRLIHTLITNSILKYSPDELEIYLLDFKDGIEFQIYANYNIPNFKVISVASEREFGLSVLSHLVGEMKRRAGLFKSQEADNASDIKNYRENTGKILPRILLIVDEYQQLFIKSNAEEDSSAKENLQILLSEGRGYGIHVILATQSIANVEGLDPAIYEYISVRIALWTTMEESELILKESADAIRMISEADEGKAIYNPHCGAKELNSVFRVGYLTLEHQKRILKSVSEYYNRKCRLADTRVMLTHIEDNRNSCFMKFIFGEHDKVIRPNLYIGDVLSLNEQLNIDITQSVNANMLMIGKNKVQARTLCVLSLLSLLIYKHDNPQKKIGIYVFDYALNSEYQLDFMWNIFCSLEDPNVLYANRYSGKEIFKYMYEKILGKEYEETFYIFLGMKYARDFRDNSIYEATYYEMLNNLLKNSKKYNCFGILWDDNIRIFNNNYPGTINYFDKRIALQMNDEDGEFFVEESSCSRLGNNNVLYFDIENEAKRIKTYSLPDEIEDFESTWIKEFINVYKGQ